MRVRSKSLSDICNEASPSYHATVWSYCDNNLTWDAGRVGVLVHELHVLHQHLAAHAELVADGAAAGVGAANHALVLLQQYTSWNKVSAKTIKYTYSLKIKYIYGYLIEIFDFLCSRTHRQDISCWWLFKYLCTRVKISCLLLEFKLKSLHKFGPFKTIKLNKFIYCNWEAFSWFFCSSSV